MKFGIRVPTQRSSENGFRRENLPESRKHSARCKHAFTLTELLAVFGVLMLLAALAVPVLANGKSSSQRSVCASNMSRIGRALAMWGTDRGDLYPWHVLQSDGGTRNHISGLNANIWFQFAWISNELSNPKVLACPSDRNTRVAQDFTAAPGGLLTPSYMNNAISYTLSHPYPEHGRLILSTDRSMLPGGNIDCGLLKGPAVYQFGFGQSPTVGKWGDFMHPNGGNLLFSDGSVEQVDGGGLGRAIELYRSVPSTDRQTRPHFQFPRSPIISANDN